jgi:aminoglycoside phosphotransferase (APT) family kinase protein
MKPEPIRKVPSTQLREQLQSILRGHLAKKSEIRGLRRRRSNYSSSYPIENLEIDLSSGKALRLVFKDLSPASKLDTARNIRPEFLYSPHREIETYRQVLDSKAFQTPIFYGAVEEPAIERYWIFLERVEGRLLWQVGKFQQWERAAKWLARFHSHFQTDQVRACESWPFLFRYRQDSCLDWMERAEHFLSSRNDVPQGDTLRGFRRVARKWDHVVKRLLSMPQRIIHGEFYPSNVIVRQDGIGANICPIDWEVTAIGPAYLDLAALASGKWSLEQKQRLVRAYQEALDRQNGSQHSDSGIYESMEYCQLYLAVQWLGWAGEWSPPKDHAQDWLREALQLAKRLGL